MNPKSQSWCWDSVVGCLPNMPGALVVQACDPSAWEVEAAGSEACAHLHKRQEFEASLTWLDIVAVKDEPSMLGVGKGPITVI